MKFLSKLNNSSSSRSRTPVLLVSFIHKESSHISLHFFKLKDNLEMFQYNRSVTNRTKSNQWLGITGPSFLVQEGLETAG